MKEGDIICYQYQVWINGYSRDLRQLVTFPITAFKNPFNPTISLNTKSIKSFTKVVGWRIKNINHDS